MKQIFQSWWPMATSWLLMALEWPIVSAVLARLSDPVHSLAAFGGVAFPLAMMIEAPIIHFLAASTTLCKSEELYYQVRRYMLLISGVLTVLHILLACTPLFQILVVGFIHPPPELQAQIQHSLMIMIPWTPMIAYRRFHQGILIRAGRSRYVGLGTAVRLLGGAFGLLVGTLCHFSSGALVGAVGVTAGVTSEALFIGIVKEEVFRKKLLAPHSSDVAITFRSFLAFYAPLATASVLYLSVQPIGSAAMSRMPNPLLSLAVWPVVSSLVVIFRSPGIALLEITISYLDRAEYFHLLRAFAGRVTIAITTLFAVVSLSPLSTYWFKHVIALNSELTTLAVTALWMALPLVILTPTYNFLQALITHARKTYNVTLAVIFYVIVATLMLYLGINLHRIPGVFMTIIAFTTAITTATAWLWLRARQLGLLSG